ncbi:MAG: hypothetical protein ACKV1O_08100 [Saprospiraceae bacterium]
MSRITCPVCRCGVQGDSTDNSYTVLTSIGNIETAILDGFTIRDGNAGEPDGIRSAETTQDLAAACVLQGTMPILYLLTAC